MKKILYLLACTLLIGCCAPGETPDPIKIGENAFHGDVITPYQFDYNGHKYIYFSGYDIQSVVHDPDCSCQKESSYNW